MTEPLAPALTAALLLPMLAGAVLGVAFYASLWWTTRRGAASPRPVPWFFGGLIIRMSGTLAAFHLVGDGSWARLLACLVGFVAARASIGWLVRTKREDGHATQP